MCVCVPALCVYLFYMCVRRHIHTHNIHKEPAERAAIKWLIYALFEFTLGFLRFMKSARSLRWIAQEVESIYVINCTHCR
jgi:hypothetical protein